jgi:hypothetical protein
LCDQKAGGRHLFGSLMSRPETTRHPPPTLVARKHVHAFRQPTRRANFVAHEGSMTSGIHPSGSRTWSHLHNATHAYDPRTACIKKKTAIQAIDLETFRPKISPPHGARTVFEAHKFDTNTAYATNRPTTKQ